MVRHEGQKIPLAIRDSLLLALMELRWPAKRSRPSINADHYVVISRGRPRPGMENLYSVCEELMKWTDVGFLFTHIAVTKNFVGSPHVDNLDTTYQYTCSLGTFDKGGELCVEHRPPMAGKGGDGGDGGVGTPDGTMVAVINTHDRVASIDGRFVHWVRGHSGGDRYSLVFYSMSPNAKTDPVHAMRTWVPSGFE